MRKLVVYRRFLINPEMDLTTEIRNGNIDNVKELLAHGANVEAHNDKGWSPLNIAIRNARFEIAKLLLEAGANPNAPDGNDWLPMSVIIRNELFDVAELLNLTGNFNGCDKFYVVNCEATKACLEGTSKSIMTIDIAELTQSLKYTNGCFVQDVANNDTGFWINTLDYFGNGSLEDAMKKGKLEFLNLLIQNGAKWNTNNSQNYSPIDLAIIKGNFDVIMLFMKGGSYDLNCLDPELDYTPMDLAISSGNIEMVKFLIKNGANLEAEGLFPLNVAIYPVCDYAIKNISLEMIKFLIEQGVTINTCDEDGYTPLTCAIEDGNIEVVKCLVANGADVNFIEGESWTPLNTAIHNNQLEIAKYLIQEGANVNLIDNAGLTPLAIAIEENGDLEFVRLLVEKGANVNDVQTGWLPMSYAILCDQPENVKFLMDSGANLNYRDMDGKKAIEVALHEDVHDIEMFKMLVV